MPFELSTWIIIVIIWLEGENMSFDQKTAVSSDLYESQA